jgi:DNA-binding transcriptional LysR family regulator
MEAEALGVERELAGADRRLAGTVRVTVTEMLATRFVAPHLPRFTRRFPDITLDLCCTNAVVSLARREADVALRLARPRENDVVSKQLAEDADSTLAGHAVIAFASTPPFRRENDWLDARCAGARVAMRSDSVSSIYAAVVAGLGIGLVPRVVADGDPALVRLPTATYPAPRIIWQAVHVDLRSSARVRAVTEFLGEILSAR